MSRFTFAALLAVALSASACSNDTPTTPTPTPTSVTDTFSGTLTKNGASSFAFNVSAGGAVYATLSTVSDTAVAVSLSLGVWNTTTAACTVVLANDNALQGTTVTGSASGVGQLCVRVADPVGKIADPVDYQLTVVHY